MKNERAPSFLVDTQRWLASVILGGAHRESATQNQAAVRLRAIAGDAAIARLGAYVGGYPARIRDALADAYPTICNLLGDSGFDALAQRYAPHAPTGHYSLDAAAERLPDFLLEDPAGVELPFLAELAALEWRVRCAFHAVESESADLTSTAFWSFDDWAGARLRFQPSVATLRSQWPLHDLWCTRNTPREDIDLVVEGRAQSVLVYRDGHAVRCETVAPVCAKALARLLAGAALGEAMAAVADEDGEPGRVTSWFAEWAGAGLIVAVEQR